MVMRHGRTVTAFGGADESSKKQGYPLTISAVA